MQLTINQTKEVSIKTLAKLGFANAESEIITENLIEAELAGRKSHGLSKIFAIQTALSNKYDENEKYFDYINLSAQTAIISESQSHLYLNANFKSGYIVIREALNIALTKAAKVPIFITSIKDMGVASGYIGAYARMATEKDFIYLGFHNSSGGLNYYGSNQDPLGTNPITIGLPSNTFPVIIDTSMAMLNWSDVEKAKHQKTNLPENTAIDESGLDTINPDKVFAVKSIAGHKGTALAYGVELLAGALSNSRIDFSKFGGWGSTFILINPEYFVGIKVLKEYVSNSIETIKNLGDNVYIPGEKSYKNKTEKLKKDEIEISDDLYELLSKLT